MNLYPRNLIFLKFEVTLFTKAQKKKQIMRDEIIAMLNKNYAWKLKGLVTWRNFSPGWDFSPAVDVLKGGV